MPKLTYEQKWEILKNSVISSVQMVDESEGPTEGQKSGGKAAFNAIITVMEAIETL